MKIILNKNESVTVVLRAKGGGQVHIRSYADRSPGSVANEASHHFPRKYRLVLLTQLTDLLWSPKDFKQTISWRGTEVCAR